MFDHFPNTFVVGQLNSRRAELAKLKNQLFGKKKISDFPADQFFFFSKIFLKNFLVPAQAEKMYTYLKKRRSLWPQKHDCIGNNIFNGEKKN